MEMIGTVWTASAKLYNRDGKLIAYCLDTPNAIAKALSECGQAQTVNSILGYYDRSHYNDRMYKNTAKSLIKYIK